MPIKVKYILTHVIQYIAPVLQRLAQCQEIDLQVVFGSDAGGRRYHDPGFDREIQWDPSLLTGYDYTVINPGSPVRRGFWGFRGKGLSRLLVRGDTDAVIVHGWSNHLSLTAALLALVRGIPVLCRTEGQPENKGRAPLRRLKPWTLYPLLRRLDGHLAIGSLNRQYCLNMGIRPERIFWAPYSVDTTLFQRDRVAPAARGQEEARIGLTAGSLRVVFVGKLIPAKRPADVIEAVAMMPSHARVEVMMIGEGELRPFLQRLAQARGVRAHFLGFRDQGELPLLYSLADVLVLPSSYEPWGLVVNEAMSMGLTAVVSEACGCGPDLVLEGRTGSVCPVGDRAAIAGELEKMAASPAHLAQLKQGAQERIKDFSIDRTLEGYLQAIRTVAAGGRPAASPRVDP
jgi:glycosyltransferase involved in cell wall biosynthesis